LDLYEGYFTLVDEFSMKSRPRIGEVDTLDFLTEPPHAIDFSDQVMPSVLSTPWLIWFLEHTARQLMLPHLEQSESTVGARVEVEHLAPTPMGKMVRCQAKLIFADQRLFSFELRAWDDQDLIARGTHKLKVIRKQRLADVIEAKQKGR
jgi:predicted thioesterase